MRKSKYSEVQIVKILKEAESGIGTVSQLCRKYSMSEATYYKWRSKYGGMEAADIKRMKELEQENTKLKQMYAELSLENNALKGIIEKNF